MGGKRRWREFLDVEVKIGMSVISKKNDVKYFGFMIQDNGEINENIIYYITVISVELDKSIWYFVVNFGFFMGNFEV